MPSLPARAQQIIQSHAPLIVGVVQACSNVAARQELGLVLTALDEYGQRQLAAVIRKIMSGSRELSLLKGLDEDDAVIAEAILRGLNDPASLPDPNVKPDPAAAAPGLAYMIHEASRGNVQALHMLSSMAEQMTATEGDMAQLGGMMRRLVDGERDPNVLCKHMQPQGESLMLAILEELGKLDVH